MFALNFISSADLLVMNEGNRKYEINCMFMKRKFKTVMVINSTNINKASNNLLSELH